MQVLREEAVHQEPLRQIPRADEIERVLVVGKLRQRRVADQLADANGDRLVEIEAVDGVAIFLAPSAEDKTGT